MAIYKRGKTCWYKFMWQGRIVRECEVGIRGPKPVPTLTSFLKERVLPWAEASFATSCPKNAKWYRNECRVLMAHKPLANAPLTEIKGNFGV